MSRYQLTFEDKQYNFQTLSEAQDFIDKLPSGAELKMSGVPLLQQLLNATGAPLVNWREIIDEINHEFGRAKTEDHRVALLATFKATMDIAETNVAPEHLETFKDARLKHYKSFIFQETLIGANICVETLDAVTQREIAAGRMSPHDNLRRDALELVAAPHQSRAELIAIHAKQLAEHTLAERPPKSAWRRFLDWI